MIRPGELFTLALLLPAGWAVPGAALGCLIRRDFLARCAIATFMSILAARLGLLVWMYSDMGLGDGVGLRLAAGVALALFLLRAAWALAFGRPRASALASRALLGYAFLVLIAAIPCMRAEDFCAGYMALEAGAPLVLAVILDRIPPAKE